MKTFVRCGSCKCNKALNNYIDLKKDMQYRSCFACREYQKKKYLDKKFHTPNKPTSKPVTFMLNQEPSNLALTDSTEQKTQSAGLWPVSECDLTEQKSQSYSEQKYEIVPRPSVGVDYQELRIMQNLLVRILYMYSTRHYIEDHIFYSSVNNKYIISQDDIEYYNNHKDKFGDLLYYDVASKIKIPFSALRRPRTPR